MLENLRTRIVASLLPKTVKQNMIHPHRLLSFFQAGQPIYTEMTVRKATREGYRLSVFVYRAVRTIVQATSGIPWVVLDKNGEVIPNHPFTQVWAKPNPFFSGQDNMEFLIAHLKLVGNGFLQPVMVNGQPREFWVCMPDMIKPVPSKASGKWLEGYQITEAGGGTFAVPPEQFIHFMQFDPGNPYWGIGDLQAAARTVDTDNEAQDTQKIQLQNRNLPSGIFQFENEMSDESFEMAAQKLKQQVMQKTKRGEPWVLGGGYKWQQMSLSPKEMDYILSRVQNKRDIAAAFGISPIFLGDLEQSSYNNMAEAKRSLYEEVVIPLLDDIRSTLNMRLAPLYGDGIFITYDLSNVSAMREDFGKRIEQAKNLWGMGIPFEQINTKLELGFEEFDGWGTGYLPFSLQPTGFVPLNAEPQVVEGEKRLLLKAARMTEESKEAYWRGYAMKAENYERSFIKKLQLMFSNQQEEVIKNLKTGAKDNLIDQDNAARDYKKLAAVILLPLMAEAMRDAEELVGKQKADFDWESYLEANPAALAWLRTRIGWAAEQVGEETANLLSMKLAEGFAEGESIPQLSNRVKEVFKFNDNVRAQRIARTETITASNQGAVETYKKEGVTKTEWYAALDERTCEDCMSMHGNVSLISEGITPPLHPSCRCTVLPVLD